jgi:preprotein translocase subunit SecE
MKNFWIWLHAHWPGLLVAVVAIAVIVARLFYWQTVLSTWERIKGACKAAWGRIRSFYSDVRTEMRKVTAPTWKEVRATTTVVVITVFIFGVYFFVIDWIIRNGITAVFGYFKSH